MADVRGLVLAGDVGGTNTRLALFEPREGRLSPGLMEVYPSREHKSLAEIVKKFLGHGPPNILAACFGVAGPVKKGKVEATNLPWQIDARGLSLAKTELINDLAANALGIAELSPSDFEALQEGDSSAVGMQALIAPGTGLGEAGLLNGTPVPTEGGHCDFAPRNDEEVELLRYLLKEFDRVSYERVLCGPGLSNIHRFLTKGGVKDPAEISQEAMDESDPACIKALGLFVSILGAEAGNLALKMLATGGVYIGGGIAPKILPKLKEPKFLEAFRAKGRMRPILEAIPVKVILNDKAALLGAARRAVLNAGA